MKSAVLVLLLVARHLAQAEIVSHPSANLNKVYSILLYCTMCAHILKGHGKETNLSFYFVKSVGHRSFTLITDAGSCRLSVSPMRGVIDYAYHRYRESAIRHITDRGAYNHRPHATFPLC
jgi:hypothetical protein